MMTKKELLIQAALGTLPFENWVYNEKIPPDFKNLVENSDDIEFLKTLNSACEALDIDVKPNKLNTKQWCTYLALEGLIWQRLYHVQQVQKLNVIKANDESRI